jgi:hypothetical protein
VVLTVRDEGIGIAAERLDDIFGMFAQANALGHDRQDGLGIGLSLARSLVELHGGSLTAHSAGIGQGSLFTVTAAACRDQAPARRRLPRPWSNWQPAAHAQRQARTGGGRQHGHRRHHERIHGIAGPRGGCGL